MVLPVQQTASVTVSVRNARDFPKLQEGVKHVQDTLVQSVVGNQQITITGAADIHLQVILTALKQYCQGIDIIESYPPVSFRETIISSSPNPLRFIIRNTQIHATVEPLSAELCEAVDKEEIEVRNFREKERDEKLVGQYGWVEQDVKRILNFAHESDPNVIVDTTKGLSSGSENIVEAYKLALKEGPLCGEPLRGLRFNIKDEVTIPSNDQDQINQCIKKAIKANVLAASPRLVEPVLEIEVVVPEDNAHKVFSILEPRRGLIFSHNGNTITAHVPEMNYIGLSTQLNNETRAFTNIKSKHWEIMTGDPNEEGSLPNKIVREIRARKGLPPTLPRWQDYVDNL